MYNKAITGALTIWTVAHLYPSFSTLGLIKQAFLTVSEVWNYMDETSPVFLFLTISMYRFLTDFTSPVPPDFCENGPETEPKVQTPTISGTLGHSEF